MSSNLTSCTVKGEFMKINVEKNSIKNWIESTSNVEGPDAEIWKAVNKMLKVPKRKRVSVNLYKIDKFSKENSNIIVPGKILAVGKLNHKVNIASTEISDKAREEIEKSGSKIYSLEEFKKLKNINVIR